jgi:hypothetical protein
MTISSSNNSPTKSYLKTTLEYLTPPIAAAIAIIPLYGDLVKKSALQLETKAPKLLMNERIMGGLRLSPTVGLIVGAQMVLQTQVEKQIFPYTKADNLTSLLQSSFIVGLASAPILAVFNGQTMGLSVRESLKRFSIKQASAITLQETAFVCGITAAEKAAKLTEPYFGKSKTNDYLAAFLSGALGSLAGHPANAYLTRQQNHLKILNFKQVVQGSLIKARAIGIFSVGYKAITEIISSKNQGIS